MWWFPLYQKVWCFESSEVPLADLVIYLFSISRLPVLIWQPVGDCLATAIWLDAICCKVSKPLFLSCILCSTCQWVLLCRISSTRVLIPISASPLLTAFMWDPSAKDLINAFGYMVLGAWSNQWGYFYCSNAFFNHSAVKKRCYNHNNYVYAYGSLMYLYQ